MKKVFSQYYETCISDEEFEYFVSLEQKITQLFEDVHKKFSDRRILPVEYILDCLSDISADIHYYILDVN